MRHGCPPARELVLALAVSAAAVASRELQYADVRYDRFHVPAFDGRAYLAMAENPVFFTVAPWGYRVLLPWLLSALPLPNPAPAFFWSTVLGLTASGVLLFRYLRLLGHGELASLLAVALFAASGPVGEAVRYQFLVEPLTLALELAFLLALQAGAGVAPLALLALLGALAKEFFLLLLPLVYLVRRTRLGRARALRQALLVAVPVLAGTLLLRLWWTPHIPSPLPGLNTLDLALERLRETWREWWLAALLLGLTPAAIGGALRSRARPLRAPAAYLFLAALVSPLLNPVAFFAADVRRLLLYALPAVMPLALVALDRAWPHMAPPSLPPARQRARTPARLLSAAALACLLALPPLVVDRYRRIDLGGTSDSLRVLAVCRETLRTARELERGGSFVFDSTSGRFSRGVASGRDLLELRRVRWFLAGGWGALASHQPGDAVLAGREASLIVPALEPGDLEATLVLHADAEQRLAVSLNGQPLRELLVGPSPHAFGLRLPSRLLFRGDNTLTLSRPAEAAGGVHLRRLRLEPPGGA